MSPHRTEHPRSAALHRALRVTGPPPALVIIAAWANAPLRRIADDLAAIRLDALERRLAEIG